MPPREDESDSVLDLSPDVDVAVLVILDPEDRVFL
jgi:hypothetical protein